MGCAFEKCYRDSELGRRGERRAPCGCAPALSGQRWCGTTCCPPRVLGHDELGEDVLELGSGPGLVTDLLDRARSRGSRPWRSTTGWPPLCGRACPGDPSRSSPPTRRHSRCPAAGSPRRPVSPCCTTSRAATSRTVRSPRSPGCSATEGCSSAPTGRTRRPVGLCTSTTFSSLSIRRPSLID